jgi:hypothetical protein
MPSAKRTLAIRDLVPSPDPMSRVGKQDGEQDAHQRAQTQLRRRFRSFQSEVPLSAVLVVNGQEVVVQGRLDGFRRIRGGVALCEIKPVPGSPREWAGRPELHGARRQLLLYADLAAHVSSPPWGDAPITTLELLLAGSDGKVAREPLSLHDAHGALERRLKVCLPTDLVAEPKWRQRQRFESFAASDSRHDRREQRQALERLRRAQGTRVLLSMPPGTGKTRVALRHALRMAFEHVLPLYWITTKIRGREIVIEELERYRRAGVPLRIAWKTAAARTCSCPRADASCPLKIATEERFFWNGLPPQLAADSWCVEDVLNVARDENLCPHELLRHAESFADVIVADLNYLIGSSSLHRRRAVLVADEAQNLSRRAREHFDAALPLDDLLGLSRRLSAAERRELRRLLPGPQSDVDHEVNPQRWLALLEPARNRGLLDNPQRKFLAVLRLWERVPADVIFAWYHGGGTPILLGAPLRLEGILDAALTPFPFVLALSGSLPADVTVRESLFPGASRFDCVEVNPSHGPAVFLCPQLDFRHPISMQDHEAATGLLQQVLTSLGGTVPVFGQNRASNEILAARLRVRGSTSLLDGDVGEDWAALRAAQPDFLLVALGGSLAESVNPPPDVFSCAVVLAAGFAAPDPFSRLRQAYCNPSEEAGELNEPVMADRIAETASRIIQAVGRVQRDPMRMKPAFLLAKSFAAAPFQRAWPQAWRSEEDRELPCWNLAEALAAAARVSHAT